MTRRYWNEEIEILPRADIARLEAERLPAQLSYLAANSDFFRAKFDQAGLAPETVTGRDELARLPFTEKRELAAAQADGSLIGANLCASLEDVVRIQATGGTTGQPLRIAFTRQDVVDYSEMGARALWAAGCRPGEIVLACMNYSLYAGGVSDHMCFETLGAATLPYGVGQSKRLLHMMAGMRDPLAIWATPSYAVRLAEVAAEEGLSPAEIGLAKGYFSGEAGLQVPGYRERIESAWGLTAADLYGIGELGLHCGECEHRTGFHYAATGFVLTELIDPETAEPLAFQEGAFEEGVVGEFVYTTIRRQACPVLRLRSHDLMQVFTEPCECGRTSFRFKVLGRSDDMFIVKGVNVFPLAVQAALTALQPRLTGEFRILLDQPPPIDYAPRIQVEVARDLPEDALADLVAETQAAIRKGCNFTAAIEPLPQGTIASEKKTRRLYRTYQGETPE
jgi:phenylacetate-CoA ligase